MYDGKHDDACACVNVHKSHFVSITPYMWYGESISELKKDFVNRYTGSERTEMQDRLNRLQDRMTACCMGCISDQGSGSSTSSIRLIQS